MILKFLFQHYNLSLIGKTVDIASLHINLLILVLDGNDPDDLIIQAFKAYDICGKIDVKMFQHALSIWGDKMSKEISFLYLQF